MKLETYSLFLLATVVLLSSADAADMDSGDKNVHGAPVVKEADVAAKYAELIPADKGLDPAWVRSLTTRGKPRVYKERKALDYIGMPVGGLFTGTLYLGGDGRLWLWDVHNSRSFGILGRRIDYKGKKIRANDGANYVDPAPRTYPFQQNFGLRIDGKLRTLDADGFEHVTFTGQYPIGKVSYEDDGCPVRVTLSAFSPFIPFNTPDSSLPATIMSYTLENRGKAEVKCDLFGWLESPVLKTYRSKTKNLRENVIVRDKAFTALNCTADIQREESRPDIVFEEFEGDTYGDWKVTGTTFGKGPILISDVPKRQGDLGATGKRVVNSYASAKKDGATGTLTSPPFTVTRTFVNVLVGGGKHKGRTCVNLLVDGKVIASVTGHNKNVMWWKSLNAESVEGKKATLQIVDNETGGWGHIGVDQVVFSDRPSGTVPLAKRPDLGTMALALMTGNDDTVLAAADLRDTSTKEAKKVAKPKSVAGKLAGSVGRQITLKPGAKTTVKFILTWHFPNLSLSMKGGKDVGREYASRFKDALSVTQYIAKDFERLVGHTKLWRDTWYDSTLPYWFLDRTMANTSTLATTTVYRFRDGRFWAYEGVGCCEGTCTHVWHYAQAPGRLFPDLARRQREEVDFGLAMHEDGGIGHRMGMEKAIHPADDGQCGRILGAFREHQMSPDDAFLKRTWPKVKKAIQYMIDRDTNRDGILEGAQHNTLDAAWYGRISFLSSLYLATLRAGEAMATEMEDPAFAEECKAIADKGATTILELYNGEYFFHELDPQHIDKIAVGTGCYIDQVFGQFWAHQVGLGYLFDQDKIRSALSALYRYNFVPHIGRFRETFTRGRWYAMDDDKGLIMCSWPKGGLNEKWHKAWQFMYFNECMTGFEWQAAAHMIAEGQVEEGMAVSRAIHDRYDGRRRNPYHEIECSDHYSRAMSSYGAFLAACGYASHGPQGYLGFSPKVREGDTFKCAFTAAGGWGSYEETSKGKQFNASVTVKWGTVKLKTLGLDLPEGATGVAVALDGKALSASLKTVNNTRRVVLAQSIELGTGQVLTVRARD